MKLGKSTMGFFLLLFLIMWERKNLTRLSVSIVPFSMLIHELSIKKNIDYEAQCSSI